MKSNKKCKNTKYILMLCFTNLLFAISSSKYKNKTRYVTNKSVKQHPEIYWSFGTLKFSLREKGLVPTIQIEMTIR